MLSTSFKKHILNRMLNSKSKPKVLISVLNDNDKPVNGLIDIVDNQIRAHLFTPENENIPDNQCPVVDLSYEAVLNSNLKITAIGPNYFEQYNSIESYFWQSLFGVNRLTITKEKIVQQLFNLRPPAILNIEKMREALMTCRSRGVGSADNQLDPNGFSASAVVYAVYGNRIARLPKNGTNTYIACTKNTLNDLVSCGDLIRGTGNTYTFGKLAASNETQKKEKRKIVLTKVDVGVTVVLTVFTALGVLYTIFH